MMDGDNSNSILIDSIHMHNLPALLPLPDLELGGTDKSQSATDAEDRRLSFFLSFFFLNHHPTISHTKNFDFLDGS